MIKAKTNIGIFDIIVCLIAVCVSVLFFLLPSDSTAKSVYIKTEKSEEYYSIDEDSTFEISSCGHTLTVEIKDGAVRIKDSSCPDKLCKSIGYVTDSSKPIVCAPAKVVIRVIDNGGVPDADIIAGR